MPRNVEIKAAVADVDALLARAAQLSGAEGEVFHQEDVFFRTPHGRLKLRQTQGKPSQLIFYDRSDESGPKLSDFTATEISNYEGLKATLTAALGARGVVRKTRTLHTVGQTRVHVDSVDGLGHFMELEVMLTSDQSVEEGQKIAVDLMQRLNVTERDLITGAYMDLLLTSPR